MAGAVFDGQTGRPVAGASIAINGQSSGKSVTDADGRFQFALSPGTYVLGFTSPNYREVEVRDVVVKAGADSNIWIFTCRDSA